MCSRCKKPPKRSAAALNQFHGPFITEEIKPIFSFLFFTIIGPLLCHLSGCAWLGTRTHLFMSCGGPGALVSGLQGTVLSFRSSQKFSLPRECFVEKEERLDLKKDEDFQNCQTLALAKQKDCMVSNIYMYNYSLSKLLSYYSL